MQYKNYLAVYILLGKNRKLLYKLLPLGLINVVVDMCSLGAVIPFFSIILRKEDSDNIFLNWTHQYFPEIKSIEQTTLTLYMIIAIILVFICKMIFVIYFNYRLYGLSSQINNDLSKRLLTNYLHRDYLYFIRSNSSSFQNTITSEVNQFVGIVQSLIIIFIEFLILFAILSFLIYIDPLVAITLSIVSIFIVFLANGYSSRLMRKMGLDRQVLTASQIQILNETFSLFREIKLYDIYTYFIEKFNIVNSKISVITNKQNTFQQIPRLTLEVLAIVALCFMVLYYLNDNRSPDFILSILAVYALAVFRVLPSISRIINSLQIISYSTSSIEVIYDAINVDAVENLKVLLIEDFKKSLVLKNVSLTISGKVILSNINIEIKNNSCIGFYGESGSGKSTVGNILSGLIEIGGGEIILDGNILSLKKSNWKSFVGYVQQDYYLIDSTVLMNVALGCSEESIDYLKVENSLAKAGLLPTILKMINGIFTPVGEKGVNLSGGQRQRLAIARALYRNPKLLILDEATSALDPTSRSVIIETINSLRGRVTIMIISHDPELIKLCDYSYVIESGRIKNEN